MIELFFNEINEKIKNKENIPSWLVNYLPVNKQIKAIREVFGMTQSQLAKRIRSSQEAIVRLENGDVEPNVATLKKIAMAFNADLRILILPKKSLKKIIEEKAEQKAKEVLQISKTSALIEEQRPSAKLLKKQIKKIKEEIINKKRSSLWT